jgi:hypothetical protein
LLLRDRRHRSVAVAAALQPAASPSRFGKHSSCALVATRSPRGGGDALVTAILEGEVAPTLDALLDALREGASEAELASAVSFAAATRIARFPTSNEFGDWDTALHTFTFANAVEQGLRRSPSVELLRGVLDAAASVHLDRFLNVPVARLPAPDQGADPAALLEELPRLLDRQQQVDEAAQLVVSFHAKACGVQKLVRYAAAVYSWMSPPSRSRRWT